MTSKGYMINAYLTVIKKIIINIIVSREEFPSEVSLIHPTIFYSQNRKLLHILSKIVRIILGNDIRYLICH